MKSYYDTVIFDMDGTLLDSSPGIYNRFNYALKHFNLPFPDIEPRSLIGPPLALSFEKYVGLKGAEINEAVDKYREYYSRHGAYEAKPYQGSIDLLRELGNTGARVALATSKYSVLAEEMLRHFKMDHYFQFLQMSGEREAHSTKKEMIENVCEFFGSAKNATVMIGDTLFDVEGAREAGVEFIGVLYGYGSRKEMEEAGGRAFASDTDELRKMLIV